MKKMVYFAILMVLSAAQFMTTALQEQEISEKHVGLIQTSNPAITGIDKLSVKIVPDKFCHDKTIDIPAIESEVKDILSKKGIEIVPDDIKIPELIVRINGSDFESVICATHVQCSFLRTVYLRNKRAALKAEVWRIDVPIRFSSPDAAYQAIIAEVKKQTEAFAENWRICNPKNESKNSYDADSTTRATKKHNNNENNRTQFTYFASKNSKIYHKAGCKSVKRINPDNLIKFSTKDQAEQTGRRPCKRCKP
jgi:hypothetical protein